MPSDGLAHVCQKEQQRCRKKNSECADEHGGKHHTTVISAVQKIAERLKDDASLRSEIHAIESMILR